MLLWWLLAAVAVLEGVAASLVEEDSDVVGTAEDVVVALVAVVEVVAEDVGVVAVLVSELVLELGTYDPWSVASGMTVTHREVNWSE